MEDLIRMKIAKWFEINMTVENYDVLKKEVRLSVILEGVKSTLVFKLDTITTLEAVEQLQVQ